MNKPTELDIHLAKLLGYRVEQRNNVTLTVVIPKSQGEGFREEVRDGIWFFLWPNGDSMRLTGQFAAGQYYTPGFPHNEEEAWRAAIEYNRIPAWSQDIGAAWKLFDLIRADGYLVEIKQVPNDHSFLHPMTGSDLPDTLGQAYCTVSDRLCRGAAYWLTGRLGATPAEALVHMAIHWLESKQARASVGGTL